ncbi:MAG: Gfo/Idh/MocA family oxidoreductase [Tepidisphaeraceae bacterium]|jgi:predicted dehydrogenase
MKPSPDITVAYHANGRRPPGLSRRSLLANSVKAAAASGLAPLLTGCHTVSSQRMQPPDDRLRIAVVGIGGMGQHYMAGCRSEHFVALCDLDHNFAGPVFEKYPSAARYHDFRRMFDREAKNFDALIMATPDHTHAVILMAALQLGKHVYCAKPVAHAVGEVRTIRQAFATARNLVTLTSVQSAASDEACSTAELLDTGAIGPVRELHLWCDHPSYPCGLLRPTETQRPPRGMDWDLWLGPAPYRPYNSAYHPWKWRAWWDFGAGTVGDMACHRIHVCFKQLQLGAPAIIYANGSTVCDDDSKRIATRECQSHANIITWEYPARGELPPILVNWYDGGMKPPRPAELDHTIALPRNGMLFVGEKGKLLAGSNGGRFPVGRGLSGGLLLPEEEFRDFPEPPMTLPRVRDHYGEWTNACKTGARTSCPIEFGCEMSEVALLGALALRTGRLLEWDSATASITNSITANALISPPRRAGWSL